MPKSASMSGKRDDSASPSPPVRYVKLGRGGAWASEALRSGTVPLGYGRVPHEAALRGDRGELIAIFEQAGRSAGKAASFAREVLDFYRLGSDAIWITFADGHLWWTRAEREVVPLDAPDSEPQRYRTTIDGWRNTDLLGRLLREDGLSSRLTKVTAYQQTICRVEAVDYLLRKLAGEEEPVVVAATQARAAVRSSAEDLIAALHWSDFETLVDLLLTRSGWSRVSGLGGTIKDADLVVEQPVTGETALVQVKSSASQSVLDDYVGRADARGYARMIFACHTPNGTLKAKESNVTVWSRSTLAEAVVRTGLFDWLLSKAA